MDLNTAVKCMDRRVARLCDKIDNIKRKMTRPWTDLDTKTRYALLTGLVWILQLMWGLAVVAIWIKTSQ